MKAEEVLKRVAICATGVSLTMLNYTSALMACLEGLNGPMFISLIMAMITWLCTLIYAARSVNIFRRMYRYKKMREQQQRALQFKQRHNRNSRNISVQRRKYTA